MTATFLPWPQLLWLCISKAYRSRSVPQGRYCSRVWGDTKRSHYANFWVGVGYRWWERRI